MNTQEKLRRKLLKYEQQIFKTIGLETNDYFQSVENNQPLHYLSFGDQKNQAIILIHGYGGSAITFYRIIPDLMNHFYVIAVDMLGFGASERPNFAFDDFQKTLSFLQFHLYYFIHFLKILKLHRFFQILYGFS